MRNELDPIRWPASKRIPCDTYATQEYEYARKRLRCGGTRQKAVNPYVHKKDGDKPIGVEERRFENHRLVMRRERRQWKDLFLSSKVTSTFSANRCVGQRDSHASAKCGVSICRFVCPRCMHYMSQHRPDPVHRAAANDVDFKTRATRGSACNGLLSFVRLLRVSLELIYGFHQANRCITIKRFTRVAHLEQSLKV